MDNNNIIDNTIKQFYKFIENNNINDFIIYIEKYKDLTKLVMKHKNNDLIIKILSSDFIIYKEKIFIIKKLFSYNINLNCKMI